MSTTRERIVDAAEALITEDPDTRPSVRAVAARAGIGASTLRHYFPSQRALMDEVVSRALGRQYSDEGIRDSSVPADRRLLTCAENLLMPIGYGAGARDLWRQAFVRAESATHDPSPSDGTAGPSPALTATGISRVSTQLELRVTGWFEALADEGVVPREDIDRRARLLLAVVDGLSISRAFPGASVPQREQEVLADAIRATLAVHDTDAIPSRCESSTATSTDHTDGETA